MPLLDMGRRTLVARLALAGLAAVAPAARAGEALPAATPSPAPMVLAGDDGPPHLARAFTRIYQEAFRRLGYRFEARFYSLVRRTALAEAGAIDGEMNRIRAYGDAHPDLVRVEANVYDFSFALFSARPGLRLERIEELRGTSRRVEYRSGVHLCEVTLRALVPPRRLSHVPTTEQGVRKLQAGRSDLFCDLDEFYVQTVLRAPALAAGPPVHRAIRFATLPTYPYLHKRHAALAPRLAAVLLEMKAEGLVDAYLREEWARKP